MRAALEAATREERRGLGVPRCPSPSMSEEYSTPRWRLEGFTVVSIWRDGVVLTVVGWAGVLLANVDLKAGGEDGLVGKGEGRR